MRKTLKVKVEITEYYKIEGSEAQLTTRHLVGKADNSTQSTQHRCSGGFRVKQTERRE